VIVDERTDFGRRAAAHLRDDVVVWLTTVAPSGGPLPTPVWFEWDGADTVHVHSLPTARRVEHVRANPRVSLNFAGDGQGGDIVVFSGTASPEDETGGPLSDAYISKYRAHMERLGMTPEEFAARYAQPIAITLTRLRGH
jgi:PPOX class probable F420-dependent enzyme